MDFADRLKFLKIFNLTLTKAKSGAVYGTVWLCCKYHRIWRNTKWRVAHTDSGNLVLRTCTHNKRRARRIAAPLASRSGRSAAAAF